MANRRIGDKVRIAGDYQYRAYYRGPVAQRSWHRFKIQAALEKTSFRDGATILDAGCGSGVVSAVVAKAHPNLNVIGLDGNPDAVAFCEQQWGHLRNVKFIRGEIDHLEAFETTSLDCIIFLEVIEHITEEQAQEVLSSFYRMLKPAGQLIISTPNRKSMWQLIEGTMDLLRLSPRMKDAQHEKLYSTAELMALAKVAGFQLTEMHTINLFAPWVSVLSEKLGQRVNRWELGRGSAAGPLIVCSFKRT